MAERAFQDAIPGIHCFGCGPDNPGGLRIKSYWAGPGESLCQFQPAPHHCAGPLHYVNGGIIATVMDCHCICTAIADGYNRAGRGIGQGEAIVFVTGGLNITFLQPSPIDVLMEFRAFISSVSEKKTLLVCHVVSGGATCARGDVTAVRVSPAWLTI